EETSRAPVRAGEIEDAAAGDVVGEEREWLRLPVPGVFDVPVGDAFVPSLRRHARIVGITEKTSRPPQRRRYVAGMPAEVVLQARGRVKDYRRARAVDGVDIVVHAGERVGLLGPNGAGKTTTLLMILGVVSPDAGDVHIAGIPLAKHRSRAASNVGFA